MAPESRKLDIVPHTTASLPRECNVCRSRVADGRCIRDNYSSSSFREIVNAANFAKFRIAKTARHGDTAKLNLTQPEPAAGSRSNRVTQHYTQSRQIFPGKTMAEVGSTDAFMMGCKTWLNNVVDLVWPCGIGGNPWALSCALQDWSTNENITGSDLEIMVRIRIRRQREYVTYWQMLLFHGAFHRA